MTIMEHVSIKTLYHLLCCMLLFISAMCALAQEHEPIGAQDERLSTLIHQRMQEAKVPALSVSVTIKGYVSDLSTVLPMWLVRKRIL